MNSPDRLPPFHLDRAIATWRRRLSSRRTFRPDDLDELEAHLRDHVDALVDDGLDARSAFFDAVERVGELEDVEWEFRKTKWIRARHEKRALNAWMTEVAMVSNYARLAFRNLRRNPGYALINVGGLSLGIAASILIVMFILYETGFDRHHEHADRIYRVTRAWFDESDRPVMHLARISIPIGPALESELPEVERAVRLWQVETPVWRGSNRFLESNLFMVDSSYFDVFSVEMITGDRTTALRRPNTAVVTPSVASRYFDDEDPIGQALTLFGSTAVEVVGLMAPSPAQSHVHPEILVSFATGENRLSESSRTHWGMFNNFATYVRLSKGADPAVLASKLQDFLRSHYEPENNSRDELRLQALTDIHLRSNLDAEFEPNGSIVYVYLFAAVAVFVLLIACFNFVNLATARSLFRAKEVGVRKVMGARPAQIVRQFLGETVVLAILATIVAAGLAVGAVPYLSDVVGRPLRVGLEGFWSIFALLADIAILVGAVAGGYPALVLSRFRPAHVLRSHGNARWRSRLRSTLVVAQFAIATVLISGMVVVIRQVDYAQQKQLGFEKELLVVLPMGSRIQNEFPIVKERLLHSNHVRSVTASNLIPSSPLVDHIGVEAQVGESLVKASLPLNPVDHDFIRTYQMHLIAGRDFSDSLASDSTEAFILNESAVAALGWGSPEAAIGQPFVFDGNSLHRSGSVIGVVRDFHFESLRERISPLVLFIMPERLRNTTVRIAGVDVESEIAYLRRVWTEVEPDQPFSYSFIDQNFGALYAAERQVGAVFGLFSALAVVIACLGLVGLASFVTERRRQEIGIRKALGASVASIVGTLTRGFIAHIGLALVLALPATYFIVRWWLDRFAYHVAFNPLSYVAVGLLLVIFAFLSVGYQAVRSATSNPVTSLRDD